MLKVPDWRPERTGSSLMWVCGKYQLSSMVRSVSRTSILEVILGGCLRFLTELLEDGKHPWHHISSYVILYLRSKWYVSIHLCAKYPLSSQAWLEVCQEPPNPEVLLWEHWWFLTGVLEDWVILYIMDHHYMWFLTCVPNFNSLEWLEVCQGPPILEVYTWRTLMVWQHVGYKHGQ